MINVAFLGAGHMADIHASNLQNIHMVNIVAICDQRIESAKRLGHSLSGTINIYDNFYKMLLSERLDAIYICLPPFAHNGQIEFAASKGIHIFTEKPLAIRMDRAKSIVESIKKYDVISHVGFHLRYGSAVKKLKELIDNGSAGQPVLFNGIYECNSLHSPWWRDREKSGGQVFEQAIHLYDLASYFLGKSDTISGNTVNLCHGEIDGYTAEDNSVSMIKFKNGALGNISATNCAQPKKWREIFTIICKNLTVHFSGGNYGEFIYTDGEILKKEVISQDIDMYLAEDLEFIKAISCATLRRYSGIVGAAVGFPDLTGKKSNICSAEEGYISFMMVDGMLRSAENDGEIIRL